MSTIIHDVEARWAIWHVTAQCNIECSYCYGSFEGSSYKADWRPGAELSRAAALEVPWGLSMASYDKVHINGGEPLLRPDIYDVVNECKEAGLSTWLLTNGTVRHALVEELAASDTLELLAVSLDSSVQAVGDDVRDLTPRAVKGLECAVRGRERSSTKIGVYVVLTAKNIDSATELFDHLEDIGVDYVNLQPVYLPASHSMRDELGIPLADKHRVAEVLQDLSGRTFACTVPIVRKMALETLAVGPSAVSYCFAAAGEYAYISPVGILFGCPSKPSGVEIGRAFRDRNDIARILVERRNGNGACPWQSGDCLGMYEMASRGAAPVRRNA